jgi:hypothetical protein
MVEILRTVFTFVPFTNECFSASFLQEERVGGSFLQLVVLFPCNIKPTDISVSVSQNLRPSFIFWYFSSCVPQNFQA